VEEATLDEGGGEDLYLWDSGGDGRNLLKGDSHRAEGGASVRWEGV